VGGSIRSERVLGVLSRLISERGQPKALRISCIWVWVQGQGMCLDLNMDQVQGQDVGQTWRLDEIHTNV
jgi:hypothetical protein